MKTLALLGCLLLAGCVSYPQTHSDREIAEMVCRESFTPRDAEWQRCLSIAYNAAASVVPTPPPSEPTIIVQQRTVTCTSSRDFPGSRLLTSVTTTCD